jgi:hypothetical protein
MNMDKPRYVLTSDDVIHCMRYSLTEILDEKIVDVIMRAIDDESLEITMSEKFKEYNENDKKFKEGEYAVSSHDVRHCIDYVIEQDIITNKDFINIITNIIKSKFDTEIIEHYLDNSCESLWGCMKNDNDNI